MEILTQALQFILSLSILIVLHELGHFIPARLFKTKVEKFYLFFDWKFSLFKFKKGETEYGIGWLPLGGYVKIAGMIDESMDKEQMKLPPQPWEFRAKPAWQRLIIMVGGVTVNVILGILIYAMVLFAWGENYLPTKNAIHGIAVDSVAMEIGLKNGDHIMGVDNIPVKNFRKISKEIIINQAKTIQVLRDGERVDLNISEDHHSKIISKKSLLIEPRFPTFVDSLDPKMAAKKVGFQKGDQIIAMNGNETPFFNDFKNYLKNNKYSLVTVQVLRGSDTLNLLTPVNGNGSIGFYTRDYTKIFETIGFYTRDYTKIFETDTLYYGFTASFPAGIDKAKETFGDYLKQMKVLFTVKDAYKEIGGFGSIASAYSTEWDWQRFWTFTAFLSIVLAIMNILPIPALDGGHVMFLLYEVITRRKPNEKVMEYAQYAGMLLLLALLLFANGNDIFKLFK